MNSTKRTTTFLLLYMLAGAILLSIPCNAQDSTKTSAAKVATYPKSQWGTLSSDKKTYVSSNGKVVLHVGDTIILGGGTTMNNTYSAIHYAAKKKHNVFNVILNQNSEPLTGQYAGQHYIIEAFSVSSNSTMFGGPKVAYFYFSVTKSLPAEVIIEQAFAANEFQVMH
jgi:hypothetical protein